MLKYNPNSKNIVILSYPGYAGGKFIANTLGLSNRAFLQDAELARKQLNGSFGPVDKLNLLKDRLSKETSQWQDLGLSCGLLFNDSYDPSSFPKEAIDLSNNDYGLFFVVAHNLEKYRIYNKIWPCARHIHLTETTEFINFRLNLAPDFDRTAYPNLSQDLTEVEDREMQTGAIIWNCNWFFDRSIFLERMKALYLKLDLFDFDQVLVEQYYNAYYNTLLRVRYV